jgi:hypothetical protein
MPQNRGAFCDMVYDYSLNGKAVNPAGSNVFLTRAIRRILRHGLTFRARKALSHPTTFVVSDQGANIPNG